MLPYRHTQPGTLLRWVLPLSLLPLGLIRLLQPTPPAQQPGLLLGILALVALSTALFWSLTVEVDASQFRFWFGPGLLSKRVPIAEIAAWETREGILSWGIHWAGKRGWLYNVSGRKALALTLRNGKRFMVGTDEPEALGRALEAAKAGR